MNSSSDLDSHSPIPTLTEVISLDSTTPISNATPTAAQEQAIQPELKQHALDELEKTLRENVLRHLLTRIDFVLEHRVKDGLTEVLQTAVDDLTQNIRQGLNQSLKELIHRAVSQEISKIQSLKSK